jgi:predicted dehydrogenase
MGATHARAFAKQPGVRVVGVSSQTPAKAATLAREVGAEPFADARALLDDPRVEAISVTLPTHLHREYTVAALAAGKHVLLEKPMGLTVADCDAMIEAERTSGRVLMIAHVLRFWPEYQALAAAVQGGELGRPLSASATRLITRPTWGSWFDDPAKSGGAALDLHIHDLDTLNWLLGEPRAVYARGQRGPSGAWDHMLTTVDYGAAQGMAEGSALMPASFPFTMALRVICERGAAELSFRAAGAQVDSPAEARLLAYAGDGPPRQLAVAPGDAYEREVAAFVECVRAGQPPAQGTSAQARLAVRLALAARDSAETGLVVQL